VKFPDLLPSGCVQVLQEEGIHVHEAEREEDLRAGVGKEVVSAHEEEDNGADEEGCGQAHEDVVAVEPVRLELQDVAEQVDDVDAGQRENHEGDHLHGDYSARTHILEGKDRMVGGLGDRIGHCVPQDQGVEEEDEDGDGHTDKVSGCVRLSVSNTVQE
jgi:hypothetical protein